MLEVFPRSRWHWPHCDMCWRFSHCEGGCAWRRQSINVGGVRAVSRLSPASPHAYFWKSKRCVCRVVLDCVWGVWCQLGSRNWVSRLIRTKFGESRMERPSGTARQALQEFGVSQVTGCDHPMVKESSKRNTPTCNTMDGETVSLSFKSSRRLSPHQKTSVHVAIYVLVEKHV